MRNSPSLVPKDIELQAPISEVDIWQVVKCYSQIQATTDTCDDFIKEMRPIIEDLKKKQINQTTLDKAFDIFNKLNVNYDVYNKQNDEKSINFLIKFSCLFSTFKAISSTNDNEKIEKCLRYLEKVQEVELFEGFNLIKNLFMESEDYDGHFFKKLKLFIDTFKTISTPNNKEKIEKFVGYFEEFEEDALLKEVKKIENIYNKGSKNFDEHFFEKLYFVVDILNKTSPRNDKEKIKKLSKYVRRVLMKVKYLKVPSSIDEEPDKESSPMGLGHFDRYINNESSPSSENLEKPCRSPKNQSVEKIESCKEELSRVV